MTKEEILCVGFIGVFSLYLIVYIRNKLCIRNNVEKSRDTFDENVIDIIKSMSSDVDLFICEPSYDSVIIECDKKLLLNSMYAEAIISEIYKREIKQQNIDDVNIICAKIFELVLIENYLGIAHNFYDFFMIIDEDYNILLYVGDDSYKKPDFVWLRDANYLNIKLSDSLINNIRTKIKCDNNIKSARKI